MDYSKPVKQWDLLGIGLGPFNLGLAALLDEHPETQSVFFDAKPAFEWHPGMLIEGTTLQVPFLADLVTMVHPRSRFSFLEYLNEQNRLYQFYFYEKFHIPRREYNHYCQWTASQLDSCRFGWNVEAVSPKDDEWWTVRVRGIESGAVEIHEAKNIVMGIGTKPSFPPVEGLKNNDSVFHSASFLDKQQECRDARSITVIGSGQSAAEIFETILENKSRQQKLNWFTRSRGFFPMEYSKLGLEHFSPDYTNYFYSLSQETKDRTLAKQDLLYKGISTETIANIYDTLYEKSIGGADLNVHMQPLSELSKCEAGTSADNRLTFTQWEKEETFTCESDIIILATGYRQRIPEFLAEAESEWQRDTNDRLCINEDYSVKQTRTTSRNIYVQNAEMHTHGPGAPDLGLGAFRNAAIINALLGRDVYNLKRENVFQHFG